MYLPWHQEESFIQTQVLEVDRLEPETQQPLCQATGRRLRLNLWLSYLGRRGDWRLSSHGRDSPLSLYMAGASLVAHMVKRSTCNAGDLGLIPGLGKIPWWREIVPTPVFWRREFHGLYSPCGLWRGDHTPLLYLMSSFREYCRNPIFLLVKSRLLVWDTLASWVLTSLIVQENLMLRAQDRETWWLYCWK